MVHPQVGAVRGDEAVYRRLLVRHGAGSLGHQGTWQGNEHWIAPDGEGGVAYRVVGGVAITLSDPACAPERRAEVVAGFVAFCDERSWTPVFYSVHDELLPVFDDLGWSRISVGEETIIELGGFELTARAVQRAIEAAKARGAKRAVLLPVSVPSHSSLMQAAAARLRERLAALEVRAPQIRYVSAVDAQAHEDPQEIRALLVRQLSSPVRWSQTLSALSAGLAQVIECGPGKVLTGLNRRIEKRADLTFLALEDPASFDAALAATHGAAHA